MITDRFYCVVHYHRSVLLGSIKYSIKKHTVHNSQTKHMNSYIRILFLMGCMCIFDRVSWIDVFDESSKGV